jgi:hemerythrin-like domain-containing protein
MRGTNERASRRRILMAAGLALGAPAAAAAASPASKRGKPKAGAEEEEEVSPAEDLMREHGVLDRLLLVYEAGAARLEKHDGSAQPTIAAAADIVARFIQDYHEKLEEQFLFPRFESAGKMTELVATLRRQHQRGRALTDDIRHGAPGAVVPAIQAFVRMYRPHAAREDTVLFPAFKQLVRGKAYEDLGEQFEDKEHALFGPQGFEGVVTEVEKLERALGIYDLAQFTPK